MNKSSRRNPTNATTASPAPNSGIQQPTPINPEKTKKETPRRQPRKQRGFSVRKANPWGRSSYSKKVHRRARNLLNSHPCSPLVSVHEPAQHPPSSPNTSPLQPTSLFAEAPDTPPHHPSTPHSPTIPDSPHGQGTAKPTKRLNPTTLPSSIPSPTSPFTPPTSSYPFRHLPSPDPNQASVMLCLPESLPPVPVTHLPRSPSRNQVLLLLLSATTPTACSTHSKPSNSNYPRPTAPYPSVPRQPPHLPRSPSNLGEASSPKQTPPLTHRPRSPSPLSSSSCSIPIPRPSLPSQSPPMPHLPRSPSSSVP